MQDIFLPTLRTLKNANTFFGSFHGLRFCMTPLIDDEEVRVEYWYGLLCYESSRMDGEKTFPLTEDALTEMGRWLTDLAKHPEKPEEKTVL